MLIDAAASSVERCAVQLAKLFGARVFATASTDEKLEAVRALGADETINYAREDFVTGVLARTDDRGVDVGSRAWAARCSRRAPRRWRPGGRLLVDGPASG